MTHYKFRIVLAGAGNAHIQIVRKWAMDPLEGVELVLINEAPTAPYSGMIPGLVSGQYQPSQVILDLIELCARAGVTFIQGTAQRIEPQKQRIFLEERSPGIGYDYLSLNVGSKPNIPSPLRDLPTVLGTKPLHTLLKDFDRLQEELESSREITLAIIGTGAGGVELALALGTRFQKYPHFKTILIERNQRILHHYNQAVSHKFEALLKRKNIQISCGTATREILSDRVVLEDGREIAFQRILFANGASPLPLLPNSQLELSESGFIKTRSTLETVSDPRIFAAGDCAHLVEYPHLAKAGVYAVRQGPVLWNNLRAKVLGKALEPFKPQKRFLTILNTSDGRAVACYGGSSLYSSLSWKLKEFIDGRWMEKFQSLQPMEVNNAQPMYCGGCGSKVRREVLSDALSAIHSPPSSGVSIGISESEDAAVVETHGGNQILSIDAFTAFLPDPFLVGRIAANNALSDIWAMNGEPKFAQAVVTLPHGEPSYQKHLLREVLEGARTLFDQVDCKLVGGHTNEGDSLQVGFSISGIPLGTLFRKAGLKEGDSLLLTKPLGTGALLAAYHRGLLQAPYWNPLLLNMLSTNKGAASAFAQAGVVACTDITGFGLAGHLWEMLDASGVAAQVVLSALPKLPGFEELAGKGIESTLAPGNASNFGPHWNGSPDPVLFDPQTSGGLLAGVPQGKLTQVLEAFSKMADTTAHVIGRVISGPKGQMISLATSQ